MELDINFYCAAEANAKKKQKQKRRNQKDSDFIPPKKRRCEPEIPPVIARSTGEASEPTTGEFN